MLPRFRVLATALTLAFLSVACTSGGEDPPTPTGSTSTTQDQLSAIMATTDHYVGAPQRVGLGLVFADGQLVSYGSVDLRFSYVGTVDEPTEPQPGPSASAVYLPTPGTSDSGTSPAVTQPSEARGLYVAEDVTFDRAGFWQVDVIADVAGEGSQRTSSTFAVTDEPLVPAPGQAALETENLTIDSKGVPDAAIDSRAVNAGDVPDPTLHRWTVADALAQHRPIVLLFATPVFCQSQFCGPVTDELEDLAKRYADRAVFIHVEIWQDFETQAITQAAADWLYRDGELTEPWLYLIDADGTILDRWAVLFRLEEVEAALDALPPMRG